MSTLAFFFWTLLLIGIYPYVIYPAMIWVLGRMLDRTVAKSDGYLPTVAVVTAAYNESATIEATVRNKLAQDYPTDRLHLIVVSDSSDDGTDEIVNKISAEDARVRLIRQTPRQGKTAALNLAMTQAHDDIIVFSDANSIYRRDAVRRLVRNFADLQVGYVTGKMLYVNPDGSLIGDGCSAFMRYENTLRANETRVGSIVGVDGGVDAVVRRLYRPMRADQLPDFVLPLRVVEQGFRVVFESEAVVMEETLTRPASEYRMRVRVALRALWALRDNPGLLNPMRSGLYAWQLASHKLLRYLSFAFLGSGAILAWFLASHESIYEWIVAAEIVFAALVLSGYLGPRWLANRSLPRYCSYFFLLNLACAVALFRFIRGEKQVVWQPRTG